MSEEREFLSWRTRATLLVGRGFLHVLGRTWRIRVVNGRYLQDLRSKRQPFIFSLWHGQILPLLWHHREQGVTVLISEHRDGELVARAAESLGYGLIRGSSTRGAERALISLVRELQAGHEVAITPDGPRGPAAKFAPGALVAAQRSDSFILPVAASADRAWRLKSWDRFMIPKPFARVTVAYAIPTKVSAPTSRAAAEEGPRFERLMSEAVELASG
ncbi:MAG TPA: lysophospholipid acyltransferase family protein [Gemmatimonadaceae bacterium]|nr:lysophospholipid acyltransferase family protein [Gemmatimonadaceae bacterium]